MSAGSYMDTRPVTLRPDESIRSAAEKLLQHKPFSLPVVDAAGRLAGIFGMRELAAAILPRAVTVGPGDYLPDVSFLSETSEAVQKRLQTVGSEPVSRHMRAEAARAKLSTPLAELLFLFHRRVQDVPVVDERTGQLLGTVSPWTVLSRLLSPGEGA